MKIVQLNPSGNFDSWDPKKLSELKNKNFAESFTGGTLLFENDFIRLWELTIPSGKRLPFSIKNNSYMWSCPSGGTTITHTADGSIQLYSIDKGETQFFNFKDKHHISDVENIGENKIIIHIIEQLTS